MTNHPGDNADNRFRAFWAGLLGFVSFGIVLFLALKAFGPGNGENSKPAGVNLQIVETRKANLAEVRTAQVALAPEEALDSAKDAAVTALSSKKAGRTEVVVPNSPTDLKRMRDAGNAPPAAASGEGEGNDEKRETPEDAAKN